MKIQYKYAVALTAALALFMAVLDTTIVNVALVEMERDFKTNINNVQWVITGYILAQAAIIPATGYFGNRFGIKRVFMLALFIFTVGSLLCGLSPHIATGTDGLHLLIAFRVLQGIGGGMLFPLGSSIAFGAFPPTERAASSAVIAIPILFAPALGPTVGGLIVDSSIGWPGVFFINIPVGIIALVLVARILKPDEKEATGTVRAGFDYAGLFLSIIGVILVVYAFVLVSQTKGGSITPQAPNGVINGWGYWLVWVLLGGGIALLALFSVLELFVIKDPVLDLRLFVTRDFRVASIATWAVRGIVFGSFLLIPIFLQQFQGRTAVHTGLILMAQGIGAMIGITMGSRLYDRIGPRTLTVAGLVILTGSTLWLVAIKPDSGTWFFVPILFLRGIGFGWSNLPLQTVALGAITGRALPKANSLYNAAAQIFSSIGTALVTTILVQRVTIHAADLVRGATSAGSSPPANLGLLAGTDAVSDVFKILTVGTLAAAAIALLLPRQSLKQQQSAQSAPVPAHASPAAAQGSMGVPAPAYAMAQPAGGNMGYRSQSAGGSASYPSLMPPAASGSDAMEHAPQPVAPPYSIPPPGVVESNEQLPYAPMPIPQPAMDTPSGPEDETRGQLIEALARFMQQQSATSQDAIAGRIAALEQAVAHLMEVAQYQPAPASSFDEERIGAIEQSLGNLDRYIRSLPPGRWHQMQDQRLGTLEHRIAELERTMQHLVWGTSPENLDGNHTALPNGAAWETHGNNQRT